MSKRNPTPPPAWIEYVSTAVHAHRTDLKLTQRELCERMAWPGFERVHLSRLERGLHKPSIELVARIAQALGTTASALVLAAERWAELEADAGHRAVWQGGIAI